MSAFPPVREKIPYRRKKIFVRPVTKYFRPYQRTDVVVFRAPPAFAGTFFIFLFTYFYFFYFSLFIVHCLLCIFQFHLEFSFFPLILDDAVRVSAFLFVREKNPKNRNAYWGFAVFGNFLVNFFPYKRKTKLKNRNACWGFAVFWCALVSCLLLCTYAHM